MSQIESVAKLTADDVQVLHRRLFEQREPDDRVTLTEHYASFARSIARRMCHTSRMVEDVTQVAFEALLQAIDRFDPNLGVPFVAFATPTIEGAIKRHYRDAGWAIRVPRFVHELAPRIRDATEQLVHDLGRRPTYAEIADYLGLPLSEVRAAADAMDARRTASLDATQGGRPPSGDIPAHHDGFAHVDMALLLDTALSRLSENERELIRLYFREGLTQSEIAARWGSNQMHVSRSLRRTLRRLRVHMLET